jgi:hypothetical protein
MIAAAKGLDAVSGPDIATFAKAALRVFDIPAGVARPA